jgi:pimeloyl-ACP methyl ester carboxylesterase
MIPAVGKEGDVAMPLAEAYAYYGTTRGAVPNYTNAFAVMSREHTLPWDAQASAGKIKVPTLMIHSERALAPALARKFFAGLGGPKQELWVEPEGQIDFYDRPERIEPAAERMTEHFRAHLS